MAPLFETYRIRDLTLRYETSATTGISGKFYLYFDSDAKDEPAVTVEDFSQQMGCQRTVLWDRGLVYKVPRALMHRSAGQKLFVRSDTDVPSGDITLYDAGTINTLINPIVLTNPGIGGIPVGELWAEYCIELHTPNVSSPKPGVASTALTMYETTNEIIAPVTAGALTLNPYSSTYSNDVPVVDVNGFGPMTNQGARVPRDGKYRITIAHDSGGTAVAPGTVYEIDCVAQLGIRPTQLDLPVILNSSDSNSTGDSEDRNIAETNASWVTNLLKDEFVDPIQNWAGVIGDALLRKGSSMAIEFIEALAFAEVQKTRSERKTLLSPEEWFRVHGPRRMVPGYTPGKRSEPSTASPIKSDVTVPQVSENTSSVKKDKEGRAYVVIRPGTLLQSEVRSYLDQ